VKRRGFSWPSAPTVASVGCYLNDIFWKVDSEELAEQSLQLT